MFQIAPNQTYSQEMERIAMDLFNSFVLVFLQFNILFVLLSKICTDDPPRVRIMIRITPNPLIQRVWK